MLKSNVIVIEPAASYDLITSADVIQELQLTNPSQSDIDLINKHIAGISASIAKYCDRVFPVEKVEETFFQSRSASGLHRRNHGHWLGGFSYPSFQYHYEPTLYTKRWPIIGIDSVYVDDVFINNDSNDVSLRIDSENGAIYRLSNGYVINWSFSKDIVITYTGGYDPIPEDLQRIAIRWSEMAWFASGQDSSIKTEQVYDIASVTYDTTAAAANRSMMSDVPDEIKVLLEPYMRHWNFA